MNLTPIKKVNEIDLSNLKVYIDNTPFPDGIIKNYDPLIVFIMKENIYSTSPLLTTIAYALILVFAMLLVIIVGICVKF